MNNNQPKPGTPVNELDTPALLVDMNAVDSNYRAVAKTYHNSFCKMRQHTKNIKSPFLAQRQIDMGGTVGGICTAKLSEADVMVKEGIRDIIIANQIVGPDKITRLCNLEKIAEIKVCVDNSQNVRDISQIATSLDVEIGVLIEVNTSSNRAGVRNPDEAVNLAKLINKLTGIRLDGVMSHQHLAEYVDHEHRILTGKKYIQICLDVKNAIEAEGIPVNYVSSGETFSYDTAAQMTGVNDAQGGSYALMCTRSSYMKEFTIANKVLGTIISTPKPGIAIGDIGSLAFSLPLGMMPEVEDMADVKVEKITEYHTVLKTTNQFTLNVGDKFKLLPYYQDLMINRWDQFVAIRDEAVDMVLEIPGRGCYH